MRLFIAIEFTEKLKKELLRFQKELRTNGMSGRFVPPENFHLTLAFIGEYHDPEPVLEAMESVPFEPFDIKLSGVGCFHDLYWTGIEDNPNLLSYTKKLRRALSENEIPYDRKKFSPHITLVRKAVFKNKEALAITNPPKGSMHVEKISLMRSDRGKNGMVYTELGHADSIL